MPANQHGIRILVDIIPVTKKGQHYTLITKQECKYLDGCYAFSPELTELSSL